MNDLPCLNEIGLGCDTMIRKMSAPSSRISRRGGRGAEAGGLLTATRVLGSISCAVCVRQDVVIDLVRETKPHFDSLRRELAQNGGDLLSDGFVYVAKSHSGWHDGRHKDCPRLNHIRHDAEQLITSIWQRFDLRVSSVSYISLATRFRRIRNGLYD